MPKPAPVFRGVNALLPPTSHELLAAMRVYYLYTIDCFGPDRCLFGTECPGIGSSIDPATGNSMDNVKVMIEKIEWLSAEDRKKIFEDNARAVFKLAAQ